MVIAGMALAVVSGRGASPRGAAPGTWCVGISPGTPVPPGWVPVPSLAEALSRAAPGDAVRLGQGRFAGHWRIALDLEIAGEGAARTVLLGDDPGQPVFTVAADRSVRISGVMLRGRAANLAPGIVAEGGALELVGVAMHGWGPVHGTPALDVRAGAARLVHTTFVENGIGIRADSPAAVEVENSIVCNNTTDLAGDMFLVRDSLLGSPWPGTGNRVAGPFLVDPLGGDLHLLPDSPARGLARWQRGVAAEADGEPRWPARDGAGQWRVDAGADQFVDTDLDGLPSYWEIAHGLDPSDERDGVRDTDGDGLTNDRELVARCHPAVADTDGDGLNDGAELEAGLRPDRRDTDRDGLPDGDEERIWQTDPRHPDTDGDGMPDGFEAAHGLAPLAAAAPAQDSDRDGYPDRTEYELGTRPADSWSPPSYRVDASGSVEEGRDGSPERPFASPAEALARTTGPAVLILAAGEYAGGLPLRSGVTLRGQDSATTFIVARDPGSVVRLDGAQHVRLLQLTLRGGNAERGGGICADASTLFAGQLRIEGCVARQGGGLALRGCAGVVLERVVISGNRAEQGGGLALEGSFAMMDGVALLENRAVRGGALHAVHSDAGLRNAWLCGNRARSGGAFWIEGGMRPLLHLTLVGNRAQETAAIGACRPGPLRIINSIAWDHAVPGGSDPAGGVVWDSVLTDIPELLVGDGIRTGSPRFRSPATRDYHLEPGSTAVDAGRLGVALSRDIDGEPRATDGDGDRWVRPDLGADELEAAPAAEADAAARPGPSRVAPAESGPDSGPRIVAIGLDQGRLAIDWIGRPGAFCEVETCIELGQWERVGSLIAVEREEPARWLDPRWDDLEAIPPFGFYRIRELRTEPLAPAAN